MIELMIPQVDMERSFLRYPASRSVTRRERWCSIF